MKAKDFDYEILKKALGKVPEGFELEHIDFDKTSFKLVVSVSTSEDFALKRAKELFDLQLKMKKELGD